MSRISWNAPGERFFETGVDRGVLYVDLNAGVPWTGLISVSESPSGGEARPYYQDGIKYLNLSSKEEFEATINAFTAPKEFAPCDGVSALQNGLFATQQPRKAFSLSYRTMIGNDVDGQEHGYKIHLVYNALAGPSERSNNTLGDNVDPNSLSWQITTLPPSLSGLKPTAHFVIDSRYTPAGLLKAIEDILYGSDAADPRMPLASELVTMFQSEGPVIQRNLLKNPTFRYTPGTVEIRRNYCTDPHGLDAAKWTAYTGVGTIVSDAAAAYSGSTGLLVTCGTTGATPRISNSGTQALAFAVGDTLTLQAKVRLAGTGWQATASPFFLLRGPLTAGGEWSFAAPLVTQVLSGGWILASLTATIPAGATGAVTLNIGFDNKTVLTTAAQQFHVDEIGVMKEGKLLPWFTGGTTTDAASGWTYSWTGTANSSASIWSAPGVNSENLLPYSPIVGGRGLDGASLRIYNKGLVFNLFAFQSGATVAATPDAYYACRLEMRSVVGAGPDLVVSPRIGEYTGAFLKNLTDSTINITLPSTGEWVPVSVPAVLSAGAVASTLRMMLYTNQPGGWGSVPVGPVLEVRRVILQQVDGAGDEAGPYLDGSMPDFGGYFYSWEGTPDGSSSVLKSWN